MQPSPARIFGGATTTARSLPSRPRTRTPLCEDCGEGDVASYCECCGQELCQRCWGRGDEALCGGCRGGAWEEAARAEEVPVGLLSAVDEIAGRVL